MGNANSAYNVRQMKAADPTSKRLPPRVEEALKKEAESAASRSRSRVNVPAPTGRRPLTEAEETELSFMRAKYAVRCRRGEREIRAEMEAEKAAALARPPPQPTRQLIGDAEKTRLQRLREFNGRLPEENQAPAPLKKKSIPALEEERAYANDREILEDMFDKITAEIEEREAFLAEMTAAGVREKHETAIRAEIATRVGQLRRLDKQIKEREAAAGL